LIKTPADKEPGDDDDGDDGCGGLFTELRSDEIKITTLEERQPEKKKGQKIITPEASSTANEPQDERTPQLLGMGSRGQNSVFEK